MASCIRYSEETITDIDDADDIALLENTSKQAESLLQCLEQAGRSFSFHINTDKTDYIL